MLGDSHAQVFAHANAKQDAFVFDVCMVVGATAYGVKVDIYSAAVTFYELFEQTPFDPTMPFAMAMTPRQCGPLIRKMGQHAPDDRPSAVEMIRQFEATGLARTPGVQHGCCAVS